LRKEALGLSAEDEWKGTGNETTQIWDETVRRST